MRAVEYLGELLCKQVFGRTAFFFHHISDRATTFILLQLCCHVNSVKFYSLWKGTTIVMFVKHQSLHLGMKLH